VLHALWLIVLLKFVTPPLFRIEFPSGGTPSAQPRTTGEFAETGLASWISDNGSDRLFVDEATPSASFGGILLDGDDSVGSPLARDVGSIDIASVETEGNAGRSPSVLVDAVSQLARSLGSRLPDWLPAGFAAIWAAGSAAWFVLAGVRLVRFRRQLGRTRPAGDALQRIADEVAERLGLRARPIVRLTDANLPPLLTTFRRRGLVLLPSELLRGLSEPQQAAIIAHELAHFRRGDHWVRWLEFVVVGLYWWHPVAWLARRQLQQAEESCCDAWVLRVFPDQARGYAQALLATVDFLSEVRTPAPAGACGFGRVHSLKRRLEMILKRTWRPDLSSAARLTLFAVALGVLPWTPRAFSQSAPSPDDPKKPAAAAKNAEPAEPPTAAEPAAAPASTGRQNVPAGAEQLNRYEYKPTMDHKPTIEQRLDRLESMLNRLMTEMMDPSVTPKDAAHRALEANRLKRNYVVTHQPRVTANPTPSPKTSFIQLGIQEKLAESEVKIESLKLELKRAQDQRDMLEKQLKDPAKGGTSTGTGPRAPKDLAPLPRK
jgi:beta-lactamase regulating signal transducer with metallopeptidase domain